MLEPSDKKFVVKTHLLISSLIALVAVGLLFVARPLSNVIINFLGGGGSKNVAGDTPVVIIGGSMKFKDEDQTDAAVFWVPVTANQVYSLTPTYPITTIAVKVKSAPDSGDSYKDDQKLATDLIRIDITQDASWEIDEYTRAGPVAKLTGTNNGNQINLALTGAGSLCPETTSSFPLWIHSAH